MVNGLPSYVALEFPARIVCSARAGRRGRVLWGRNGGVKDGKVGGKQKVLRCLRFVALFFLVLIFEP